MIRGAFDRLVTIQRAATTTNDYGEEIPGAAATVAEEWARVRFGPAGEKREAAQEEGAQAATFNFIPTDELYGVRMTDTLNFDGSDWDITEIAPLGRNEFRITALRAR